jgi:hypothetical protein
LLAALARHIYDHVPQQNAVSVSRPKDRGVYSGMTKLKDLEREIASLSEKELSEFRRWYAEFDARGWDRELEADARAGSLDHLAAEALADHRAGRSRPR